MIPAPPLSSDEKQEIQDLADLQQTIRSKRPQPDQRRHGDAVMIGELLLCVMQDIRGRMEDHSDA